MSKSNELSPKSKDYFDDSNLEDIIYVITRTGRKEILNTDQIVKRLQMLTRRHPKINHINPHELMLVVAQGLKSGITTYEIDEYAGNAAASLSISNPYYMKLAARIIIDNHQKNTDRSFVDKMRKAYLRKDVNGNVSPLLSSEFFKYVEKHQDRIEPMIDYNRDFLFDFFGFRTFQTLYGLILDGKSIERPQDLLMRTAISLHMNSCHRTEEGLVLELNRIKETYDALSNKTLTQASPTYFNAGSNHTQYSSCFLLGTEDTLEGIEGTGINMARISKWGGGIGVHINCWRSKGMYIRSTNGRSNGIVPFIREYNAKMRAWNQGGRRMGSAALYLMPHHPDIMDFLKLKLPSGLDEERARDLFYAMWIPDIFMERVLKNGKWSLFDPDVCGDLSDNYDSVNEKAYTNRYLELENNKKYTKQINARAIWEAIFECNKQKGVPYLCSADTVNQMSMQKNIGVIKSSNLCVSGDTLILTENGYQDIKSLTENNKGKHTIWNGFEFAEAQFAKTGINKQLLKLTFSDGVELKCTPEHKFALFKSYSSKNHVELKASELEVGHKLIKHEFPVIDIMDNSFKYPYTHGFFCGDGTYYKKGGDGIDCTYPKSENQIYCHYHCKMGFPDMPSNGTDICQAKAKCRIPCADLYHDKKELIEHMEFYKQYENKEQNRIRLSLYMDIAPKFEIPVDYSLDIKLKWLAGYLDADGTIAKNGDAWSIQVSSINKEFLMNVKLFCNTLGVNPMMQIMHDRKQTLMPDGKGGQKLFDCQTCYRLCFSTLDSNELYKLGLKTYRLKWNNKQCPMRSKKQYISVTKIEKLETPEDTYCFNEPKLHMGIFNGIIAKNCSEITLVSNSQEYAVCNLCSVSLPVCVLDSYTEQELQQPENERRNLDHEHPVNPTFDFVKLIEVCKIATTNLNNIIEKNFYPTVECKRSNMRHRPIGIGLQGLADTYMKMRFPYDSAEARKLNKLIIETMYFAALSQSTRLAREEYQRLRLQCKELGSVTVTTYNPENYDDTTVTFNRPEEIPKTIGSYPSMLWNGGSPISKGVFHWELYGLNTSDLSGMYDWETLRNHILTFGVKNSLLIALMPTASTSQFLGNNECFEPYTSNLYKRKTLAGEFIMINKWLIHDLYRLGMWNLQMKEYLIACEGSIQYIDGIPEELKALYKTAWEINQEELIQQAIDRQPFVDQAQSLNWYMPEVKLDEFTKLAFKAWRGKLKTWKYYVHTKAAMSPQKFSIDPALQKDMAEKLEREKHLRNNNFLEPKAMEQICDLCGA